MNRYKTLKSANGGLAASLQAAVAESELHQSELGHHRKEKANEALSLNNAIANLQRGLELRQHEAKKAAADAEAASTATSSKT